jgi:GNAT superfamily N-acetyltransferase
MQTHVRSTLTVRPFTADDYADITRLHNQTFAEFSFPDDEFQVEDALRPRHCRWARWVAECDGRIVGFVQYDQNPHIYHPRKFHLSLVVDPEYFGRGIGRRLYDLVLGEVLQFDPLTVDEWARANMACRVGFLERRGFIADMRMWTSSLDLTRFEPAPFAADVASVEAQGIQLRSWAELGFEDPTVRRRTYEMWLGVRDDVPMPPGDVRTPTSYEQWWERIERPQLLPAGFFVAVDGDQYVAMSQLWLSPEAGELRTGLTGVRREYRRRGIALALKVRALEFGQAQGYQRVVTENEINNQGMIGINDRLGFIKNPAWVHYRKSFET